MLALPYFAYLRYRHRSDYTVCSFLTGICLTCLDYPFGVLWLSFLKHVRRWTILSSPGITLSVIVCDLPMGCVNLFLECLWHMQSLLGSAWVAPVGLAIPFPAWPVVMLVAADSWWTLSQALWVLQAFDLSELLLLFWHPFGAFIVITVVNGKAIALHIGVHVVSLVYPLAFFDTFSLSMRAIERLWLLKLLVGALSPITAQVGSVGPLFKCFTCAFLGYVSLRPWPCILFVLLAMSSSEALLQWHRHALRPF